MFKDLLDFMLLWTLPVLLVVLSLGSTPPTKKPVYHPMAIADLAQQDPSNWSGKMATHVMVKGWLAYKAGEDDGDLHQRICDQPNTNGWTADQQRKHCVVVEQIPEIKDLPQLTVGHYGVFCGVTRYDAELPGHHWWELHPQRPCLF